jgi:O-antigen/teichoic acid export membrane protein
MDKDKQKERKDIVIGTISVFILSSFISNIYHIFFENPYNSDHAKNAVIICLAGSICYFIFRYSNAQQ